MNSDNFTNKIILIVVVTLAIICGGVVAVLMHGLFDSNVNNDKVFEIIGPAFNTVIGAFVGLLGGLSINRSSNKCKD